MTSRRGGQSKIKQSMILDCPPADTSVVDLLPRHLAHAEYRRCLLKREESCGSYRSDLADHGISETERSSLLGDEDSLLGDEEPSPEITKSCLEWCIEHSIEYIEACESNADFDKCKTINVRFVGEEHWPSTSASQLQEKLDRDETPEVDEADHTSDPDESKTCDFEDVEMLMSEIGNMRNNLKLMPDFQMRETAAKLAMKMAAMSGNINGGEEGFD
ncbi:GTP binding [Forsythia ovata]|uniref:GTP binding n=1 Tax=Forsythia ovata TaxID=205694 RepID=A0ABD1PH99_9LAMI